MGCEIVSKIYEALNDAIENNLTVLTYNTPYYCDRSMG
jgi:hypothetical protein